MATDGSSFYVADLLDNRIRKVAADGTSTTVVGTGDKGFAGDGGPATAAKLAFPRAVARTASGVLYIADTANQRVRRVDVNGTITTLAGTGTAGFGGDGGPAQNALLKTPSGVAVGPAGEVYVADTGNSRVRRIATDGTITTIAGNGDPAFGGDGGPATSASLNAPRSVAVDPVGRLLIADEGNHRLRRVDTTGVITTVAGTGTASSTGDGGPATGADLTGPSNLVVGPGGDVYFNDDEGVRRIDGAGIVHLYVSASTATGRAGLVFDSAGDLISGERYRIVKVSADGTSVSPLIGCGVSLGCGDGGPGASASLSRGGLIALSRSGDLFISELFAGRIRRVGPDGVISTYAGSGQNGADDGTAVAPTIPGVLAVAVDIDGDLLVSSESGQIWRVTPAGDVTLVAGTGVTGFSGDGGPATAAQLDYPSGLLIDRDGSALVADSGNNRVRRIGPDGTITTVVGNGTPDASGDGGPATSAGISPASLAFDRDHNLLITAGVAGQVRKVDAGGVISTIAGTGVPGDSGDGGPATSAQLMTPFGIAVDSLGNIYVADVQAHRVRRIDTHGTITTIAGNGIPENTGDGGPATAAALGEPFGLAIDTSDHLYVSETGGGPAPRVRRVALR
jgi:sugar lactone lactonase YvrE